MQSGMLLRMAQKGQKLRQNKQIWDAVSQALNILTKDGRLNPGLTKRIVDEGYIPARLETRTRLGLSPIATVVLVGDGMVPDESQTIRAVHCSCGQWFISNHPRRKHCFLCRPFRGHLAPQFESTSKIPLLNIYI